MKSVFILLLSLIALGVSAQQLTIASYNIRNDNEGDVKDGNGWQQRYPYICDQIKFYKFDIFGAQEVKHNQLMDMLSQLPDFDYVGIGRDDGKTAGEYSPIFYNKKKFDVLQSGTFWLAPTTDKPVVGWDAALPRICSWGQFEDRLSGKIFWFFNLHMDHVGIEARRESAKLVLNKIKEMSGSQTTILTGDFNVDQSNESYTLLNTSGILQDSYELSEIRYTPNGTFNRFNPNHFTTERIDHMFVTGDFRVKRYGILTDTYRQIILNEKGKESGIARTPSDHFPIMAELEY